MKPSSSLSLYTKHKKSTLQISTMAIFRAITWISCLKGMTNAIRWSVSPKNLGTNEHAYCNPVNNTDSHDTSLSLCVSVTEWYASLWFLPISQTWSLRLLGEMYISSSHLCCRRFGKGVLARGLSKRPWKRWFWTSMMALQSQVINLRHLQSPPEKSSWLVFQDSLTDCCMM
jgi:hypothetical protein